MYVINIEWSYLVGAEIMCRSVGLVILVNLYSEHELFKDDYIKSFHKKL